MWALPLLLALGCPDPGEEDTGSVDPLPPPCGDAECRVEDGEDAVHFKNRELMAV